MLVDREVDYAAMLRHHTAYNSLVHDVLGMRFNRVTLPSQTQKVDVETGEAFWQTNAGLAFPTVADRVDQALSEYKAEKERILRSTGVNVEAAAAGEEMPISPTSMMEDSAVGRLRLALNVVPELTERKRIIDCHFSLSCAILERIKERHLGDYLLAEQMPLDPAAVLAAIRGPGRVEDKLRLYLSHYLSAPGSNSSNLDPATMEAALLQAGCNLAALQSAKQLQAQRNLLQPTPQATVPSPAPKSAVAADDFLNRFKQIGNTASSLGGMLSSVLVSGVKSMLPESTDTPLIKLVEQGLELMEQATLNVNAGANANSNLLLIDPRPPNAASASASASAAANPNTKRLPSHLQVFLVGGSNYSEYNACQEFVRKRNLRYPLTFGTTDLLTGDEFLQQLALLSSSSPSPHQ